MCVQKVSSLNNWLHLLEFHVIPFKLNQFGLKFSIGLIATFLLWESDTLSSSEQIVKILKTQIMSYWRDFQNNCWLGLVENWFLTGKRHQLEQAFEFESSLGDCILLVSCPTRLIISASYHQRDGVQQCSSILLAFCSSESWRMALVERTRSSTEMCSPRNTL